MQPKIIGVREFHGNFKKIAQATQRGASFIVTAHHVPIFRIEPIQKKARTTLWDDIKDIHFSHDDPNLSKKIDEIVYDL